ncbi:PPE family protein [Mycobacterium tuberculosis CAS/NITR204]|uniref:PPE family protein n=1 Tax=Mycobacterium tuberculosis CAS/NITR204 TaxID=1310114 RepID=R4M936_MYCTX|nr:PPE family protein [Mycobacterium tuberculosis CAS/NITR204]
MRPWLVAGGAGKLYTLATAAGAALDGTGWAVPEEDGPIAVMPPAPGMVVAANSVGADSGPRYGVKPIVMPKHGLF